MKKRSLISLLLLLSLFMGGCAVQPLDPIQSEAETTAPAESTAPIETTTPIEQTTGMITEPPPTTLYRFLSSSNYAATLNIGTGELVPPGTLTDPKNIPQPEQKYVGDTLWLQFEPSTEDLCIYFHYYHSSVTGKELLVTIIHDDATRNPLLMVFEVDFGGAGFLDQVLNDHTVFYGKLLSMVNTDYIEGRVYTYNVVVLSDDFAENETIDLNALGTLDGTEYIGSFSAAKGIVLRGTSGESVPSKALQNSLDVFYRIYDRFGIDLDAI